MRAAQLAELTGIEGYCADDTRDVLPIVTRDNKRRFVLAAEVRVPAMTHWTLVKSDGTMPRGRAKSIYRGDVVRIVHARGAAATVAEPAVEAVEAATVATVEVEAPAAAPADVLALVEALSARVIDLEARLADLSRAAPAAAAVEAGDPVDARDAYIATLLAERDGLRERAEAAEARAADFERIATDATGRVETAEGMRDAALRMTRNLLDARTRTARRLIGARAAARTARRERIGLETALRVASAEVERLAPVAALVAAIGAAAPAAAPAPAPAGLRLVATA